MFTRILVAYDGSSESEKALASAIDLALISRADLHVLTVAEDLPPYMMVSPPEAPFDPEIATVIAYQRDAYYDTIRQQAVDRAAEKNITAIATVVSGNETDSILCHAKSIKADLLVIGLHKHSALVDHLWGSTTQRLTCASPCSILAVH